MQLSCSNIFPYLLARSWGDRERVLSGDAVVIERRLRHTSFTVEHRDGGGVFLKQLHQPVPAAADSLRQEAHFLQGLTEGQLPELEALAPGFVGYDDHEKILALARIDGTSLLEQVVAGDFPGEDVMQSMGTALGTVHAISPARVRESFGGGFGDAGQPWVFRLPGEIARDPQAVPGVGREVLPWIRACPGLESMLESIGRWWRTECLIHGDLKWENVLVASGSSPIRLVDWELASIGDPAWDAANFLQAGLVRCCLASREPGGLNAGALGSLPAVAERFWNAWIAKRELDAARCEEERFRVAGFAAAGMIHSAYEHACVAPVLTPAIQAMLATSRDMMGNSHHAMRLLGLLR